MQHLCDGPMQFKQITKLLSKVLNHKIVSLKALGMAESVRPRIAGLQFTNF
jgi:hypothetical protein